MSDEHPGRESVRVADKEAGQRLDRVLAAGMTLSRTRLKALILDGAVTIGPRTILDPGHRVNAGDEIAVNVPPPEPAIPQGEAIPLDVLYEDDAIIVIDKPAGLVVHPAAGHQTGTLVNALIAHCGASLSGIGGVLRPGIVHRLDKDTTGVMVVAKSDAAHKGLAAQFEDHGRTGPLERAYLALVWGSPLQNQGTVDAPLDRHPGNREKISVRHGGRTAITHWRVLQRFDAPDGKPLASLIECRLETGRTHQIRVHMAHIGHPVMGDETYATGFKTKASRLPPDARNALESLGRQALHAYILVVQHPIRDEKLEFQSELPVAFARLVQALESGSATVSPAKKSR